MVSRMFRLFICLLLIFALSGCATPVETQPTQTEPEATLPLGAVTETDIAFLEQAYAGRTAAHGEMHDHAATGGTSDGKQDLSTWISVMKELDMDFATIVDHRQALHMELPEWDDTIFIGGSEPMAMPKDLNAATYNKLHFNMIFTDPQDLIRTVETYDQRYPGTGFNHFIDENGEWHFAYLYGKTGPTKAQMAELIQIIKDNNGMFVNVHPKSANYIVSEDPMDYWFADGTGLEVFYGYGGYAPSREVTLKNYKLWTDLLAAGKRIWATAGSDKHNMPNTDALTTVYTSEKKADAYLERFKVGDFVCGPVGIRMAIGEATMGGATSFEGKRLVFGVGDFHSSAYDPTHTYRVDLMDDKGIVFSKVLDDPTQMTYFAVDAQDVAFYRVVVYDTTTFYLHALGNPIWNNR